MGFKSFICHFSSCYFAKLFPSAKYDYYCTRGTVLYHSVITLHLSILCLQIELIVHSCTCAYTYTCTYLCTLGAWKKKGAGGPVVTVRDRVQVAADAQSSRINAIKNVRHCYRHCDCHCHCLGYLQLTE